MAIYCLFGWWSYGIWLCLLFAKDVGHLATLLMLSYSRTPGRDLLISAVLPFYPLYQAFLKTADAVAIIEELLFRRSKQDNFVPAKVRDVTWHW